MENSAILESSERHRTGEAHFLDIELADIALHVDESLVAAGLERLEQAFRERCGDVSVAINPKLLHLLEYNPQLVNSKDLQRIVGIRHR